MRRVRYGVTRSILPCDGRGEGASPLAGPMDEDYRPEAESGIGCIEIAEEMAEVREE